MKTKKEMSQEDNFEKSFKLLDDNGQKYIIAIQQALIFAKDVNERKSKKESHKTA